MATDRGDVCSKFLDVVPHALYPFQEQAILEWFSSEGGLLVSAPTGMGKTLIAEAALFEALVTRRTAYYTTPLIALTDQKFRELQDKVEAWGFHADDVGLLTGNRRINPDAPIKVVVAEILLNHLLSHEVDFTHVDSVVMDEFHWFNDRERGFVWELALTFLPEHVKALLLSATIGNVVDVVSWSRVRHGRKLGFVTTDERRVPLETTWVEDRLLPELLVELASGDDSKRSTPALVFCFARDECWETAEILKGKNLLQDGGRARIEAALAELDADMTQGAGPKLKQMLIRGVGVHHAGILPRHKEVVEALFLQKLVPVVVCTETLAAGINLPARSVVLTTLMKGPPQQKKLIAPSDAHQMFGRAGRPQFDHKGNVFALAHEDDVKIFKWKLKWDALNHASKDPGILSAKKDLERKKPSRRANQQYWTKGQFDSLLRAKPSNLESREMIPYRVLIHLLVHGADVKTVRDFLAKRLCGPERVLFFERRLDAMIENLVALGYVTRDEAGTLAVTDAVDALAAFRSIDPLYGRFLAQQLVYADRDEKLAALESVLDAPPQVVRAAGWPEPRKGPLQQNVLEPMMIAFGIRLEFPTQEEREQSLFAHKDKDDVENDDPLSRRPPWFAEMLKIAFERNLPHPEDVTVKPMWVAEGVFACGDDFFRFIKSRSLEKSEGLVLRHLLRLVLLAREFEALTSDPDYDVIATRAQTACASVDPIYTAKYLETANLERALLR